MANSNGWGDGAANNSIGWGQGANNNIGWGSVYANSSAGATDIIGLTTDSDATAFLSATAITGATQQSAIDTLVKGLKSDGLWSKMKAIYPFVTDNRNLLNYTEFFGQVVYWPRFNVTVTNNTTTAPDGNLTADTITMNSSTSAYLSAVNLANNGGTYTQSCYFKVGYGDSVTLYTSDSASSYSAAWFNLNTGTLGTVTSVGTFSGATSAITNVGNGWYRCSITFTKPSTANSAFAITMGGDGTFIPNIGSYVYAWGAQLEVGALSTYQPILTTQQAYISSQFKYNLKDPRDLDAAFRLVFNGGWTHSSTGATPNGVNGYANTNYNNSSGTLNSGHLSSYLRTNINANACMIGANDGNGRHYFGQGNSFSSINSSGEGNYNPSSYLGLHLLKRETSTETKQFYNGSINAISSITTTGKTNINFYIAARNNSGTALNFNSNQYAFSSIGDGLTDTEAANLYTRVQAFQTALSRQV